MSRKSNRPIYFAKLGKIRYRKKLRRKKKIFRSDKSSNSLKKSRSKIKLSRYLDFFYNHDKKFKRSYKIRNDQIIIPKIFSLTEKANESFSCIHAILFHLKGNKEPSLDIDYSNCQELHLDAQMYLDILLKEHIKYFRLKGYNIKLRLIGFRKNPSVLNLLASVGSFAIHNQLDVVIPGVIKYPLCERKKRKGYTSKSVMARKEIDTTSLADYVINCLGEMNREMGSEKRNDLCKVIGEVLINAEEHSTMGGRYSVGQFVKNPNGKSGLFKLLIFNFGETIYEKFKSKDCPNKTVVKRMSDLSENYTRSGIFKSSIFEEETLWTLYALQEGITSFADWKRGNGSIRFIESFFNIKGNQQVDQTSRLNILSGSTRILFDGSHRIKEKVKMGEKFKVMTFNKSGEIENPPDQNYVTFADFYFPGTMISANIQIDENDIFKPDSNRDGK